MSADTRNEPNQGFYMLSTYSSWCMYPVINKILTGVVKHVDAALKAPTAPLVAKEAFRQTIAAALACDNCDHWRLDTESPEDCDKIAKKISKILKDLHTFTDAEVGLVDPYSRKALLNKLGEMRQEWSDIEWTLCSDALMYWRYRSVWEIRCNTGSSGLIRCSSTR